MLLKTELTFHRGNRTCSHAISATRKEKPAAVSDLVFVRCNVPAMFYLKNHSKTTITIKII